MTTPENLRWYAQVLLTALVTTIPCATANAAVTVLGVQYQQDNPYPEFLCLWYDRDYPTNCPGEGSSGANVHVYLKNTGATTVTITDVTLAGYSLNTVIKLNTGVHDARSIFFYWDNPPQDIFDAGEPVWYKGDPSTIPAGGVAQAVVRLRTYPATPTVSVGVVTSDGTVTTNITVDANAPQLANVGFSPDRTKVYLHWRRNGGAAPATVWMDGVDVTTSTVTVGDPSVNFAESALTLGTPLPYLSYHVFQGVYADGQTATASLRAWSHPFLHASWGVFDEPDVTTGQAWVQDAFNRGFTAIQNQSGGGVADFLGSNPGKAWMASHGFGFIAWNKNPSDALLSFINDEIDGEDANMERTFCGTGLKLPCGHSSMGVLAARSILVGEDFRSTYPNAPTTINMDGTHKPENYYSYGQAVDVLQADPYYQKRLKDTYWYHNPEWIPLYNKATYIYAVSKACTQAAEPNSFHVILNSTESRESVNGVTKTWPFAAPQCKRIEVYYALAAGAKGISYWWFNTCNSTPCSNGLGDQSKPTGRDLWKEMGIYGNEIKTVSPLLVASHPVDLPLAPGANVWARALAVGPDTMILLVVNDNYYNDEAGFHSTDVPNANVTAALPSWMQSSLTAFEITPGGLRNVSAQVSGNQLQVNLGTLQITRMIILTKDVQLLPMLQQRYDQEIKPGICAFASGYCTNTPLNLAQQPASQTVAPGASTRFTVVAFGTSLTYQWQKNNADLADGGHYSGGTNATLTVSNCDTNDATNYRCVVGSAAGTTNTSNATLTVTTDPPSAPTANAATSVTSSGFTANWSSATSAAGYRLDVSTNNGFANFVSGYQDLDAGNVLSRSVSGLNGGTTCYYRVRAYNGNGNSGNSGAITVTTAVGPPVPTANAATSVTTNAFTANWSSSSSATGYRLDVSTTNTFGSYVSGYQDLDVGNVLSRSVTALSSGTTYYYRVRAYNGNGPSGNSGAISVATTAVVGPPPAPVANPATSVTSSSFRANWSSAYGATGYRLDVSVNSAFTNYLSGYQNLNAGTLLSVNVSGLSVGKTYCYRVRAYNASGTSGNSTTISVTTPPTLGYSRQENDLVFSWTTNVTGYALEFATNLPPTSWSPALPSPVMVGEQYVVTNTMTDVERCYRLNKPQ